MNDFRIVIIDDNEDDLILAQEMFSDVGFLGNITPFLSSVKAWNYLQETDPSISLVFMDINMPIQNGFELLQKIRTHPQLQSLPVVMLSGSSREEERIQAIQEGANAYITKPLDFTHLVEVIKSLPIQWKLVS